MWMVEQHRNSPATAVRKDVRTGTGVRQDAEAVKTRHQKGLLLVGLFKLSKAIFFLTVAAGALHLVHKDIQLLVLQLVDVLRLDPESRAVNLLLAKSTVISHHELRRAALFSGMYSGVCLIEGTGLMLEKRWAEYLTVTLTLMGLPWECYELIKGFTWFKVGLMAVNVAVLVYLVWVLRKKWMQHGEEAAGGVAG
jgi:uncharacterized membrane protein (DUF2068 family)